MSRPASQETWVVTGAARGIGLAVAGAHLQRGGRVLATHRGDKPATLQALENRFPGRLGTLRHDLRDVLAPDQVSPGAPLVVDVLFHNGGVYGPRTADFRNQDHAAVLDTIDTNALGLLRITEAILPHMASAPRPRIVAVSSLMGTLARIGRNDIAYRVSKAAMNMVFHVIAADLAATRIAMACLRPGHVRTDMGGPGGAISPAESAAAMLPVVDRLTFSAPPPFLDLTGEPLAW